MTEVTARGIPRFHVTEDGSGRIPGIGPLDASTRDADEDVTGRAGDVLVRAIRSGRESGAGVEDGLELDSSGGRPRRLGVVATIGAPSTSSPAPREADAGQVQQPGARHPLGIRPRLRPWTT